MATTTLPLVDKDGNSFYLFESTIVSAYDDGTYHTVRYKETPDSNVLEVQVTDASFTSALNIAQSLIPITLNGSVATDIEYINVNRISLVEENGDSLAVINYDNGAKREIKILSISLAAFLLLVGQNGFETTVTLTSAQILALNTTPVTLVAAPGAGKFIILEFIYASIDFNSAAYAASAGLAVKYTNEAGTTPASFSEGFLESAADNAESNTQDSDVTPTINAPLVILALTADPTTGDSAIKVTFRYRIGLI